MPVCNAYETVDGAGDKDGLPPVLVVCDHASNRVPKSINGGALGLPEADMSRHIAYDIGARGVTLALADRLGASAVLSRFSRLVIDPNRGDDDPTQVMQLYDGTIIAANARLSPETIAARRAELTEPYHAAITQQIEAQIAKGTPPVVLSIHSFTPQLSGRRVRPWQLGILYAHDDRMARPLLASLRRDTDLIVGDNEPYHGALIGDCMDRHCLSRGLLHVLIEVRNDLIETGPDQQAWAARLSDHLIPLLSNLPTKEPSDG